MSTLKPLGPQAMLSRLQELQARQQPTPQAVSFEMPSEPAPLSGQISPEGSFAPVNPFGGSAGVKSTLTPEMLEPMIERAATQHGLEPALLDALVQSESNYDPGAISSKRAIGLTQLMPDTARELGVTDPFDPAQNLMGGAKYLSQMLKRFDGDLNKAVAAYNAGPGAVQRYGGVPPYRETQRYVDKVLAIYQAKRSQ